jgi:hypothetical protein
MKYHLDGSPADLRIEICTSQTSYKAVMECSHELQKFKDNESIVGFWVAWMIMGLFFIGYLVGRWSND